MQHQLQTTQCAFVFVTYDIRHAHVEAGNTDEGNIKILGSQISRSPLESLDSLHFPIECKPEYCFPGWKGIRPKAEYFGQLSPPQGESRDELN